MIKLGSKCSQVESGGAKRSIYARRAGFHRGILGRSLFNTENLKTNEYSSASAMLFPSHRNNCPCREAENAARRAQMPGGCQRTQEQEQGCEAKDFETLQMDS